MNQQFVHPHPHYTLVTPKAQYAPLFLVTKTVSEPQLREINEQNKNILNRTDMP
jgi:hypothetical protein